MKTLILILTATVLFAQPPMMQTGEEVRVVEVKHGGADAIQRTLNNLLPGVGRTENMLIVRGAPQVLDMIEAAIKKMDVAQPVSKAAPTVELTMHLLLASAKELTAGTVVPNDLEPTVRKLRDSFSYRNYRLLDTEVMQASSGRTNIESTLPSGDSTFSFATSMVVLDGPSPRSIRLDTLRLVVNQKLTNSNHLSTIATTVTARDGQKTVIGKANVTNSEDAIFLVITPRVIE
jgi:hypothetical protein